MGRKSKWYSSSQPFDATFCGGEISVDGRVITAFMDDEDPFHVEQAVVGELIYSVNGSFTVAKKPGFSRIVITVIVGSEDCDKLMECVYAMSNTGEIKPITISGKLHRHTSFIYQNCVCLGATPMFSVRSNGRVAGMKFCFAAPLPRSNPG